MKSSKVRIFIKSYYFTSLFIIWKVFFLKFNQSLLWSTQTFFFGEGVDLSVINLLKSNRPIGIKSILIYESLTSLQTTVHSSFSKEKTVHSSLKLQLEHNCKSGKKVKRNGRLIYGWSQLSNTLNWECLCKN